MLPSISEDVTVKEQTFSATAFGQRNMRRVKLSFFATMAIGTLSAMNHLRTIGTHDRFLSETEDEDDCQVNPIADPFGKYLPQSKASVILYFIGMLYLFFGLGFVCEEYFVASIEMIIEKYNIPPDVAGATLMAAGSSSPELFAELVGTFIDSKNDAGTGTVIGSAVFNQLIIIGGAILLSPFPEIELDPLPLTRDIIFYIISIALVYITFEDGKIVNYEAWSLFLSYVVYVFVNAYWSNIVGWINKQREESLDFTPNSITERHSSPDLKQELLVDHYVTDLDAIVDGTTTPNVSRISSSNNGNESIQRDSMKSGGSRGPKTRGISVDQLLGNIKTRSRYSFDGSFSWDPSELREGFTDGSKSYGNPEKYSKNNEEEEQHKVGVVGRIIHILTHPLIWFLSWFLLDCRKHPKYFWLAFLNSIVLLGLIVFFIIQWIEKSGCLLGFSSALMGLTLGAAGTSAPDALVSFHVARNGLGDMAVSNALGSNIFDILLCLGLPWLIKSTIHPEEDIDVEFDKFFNTFVIQIGVLMVFILILVASKCSTNMVILKKWHGTAFLLIYFAFVAFCFYDETYLAPTDD